MVLSLTNIVVSFWRSIHSEAVLPTLYFSTQLSNVCSIWSYLSSHLTSLVLQRWSFMRQLLPCRPNLFIICTSIYLSSLNINVATNVAKTSSTLMGKHLPKNKRLSKIFNRNTIKVSYSCLPNVKQTMFNNNQSVTTTAQNERINSR